MTNPRKQTWIYKDLSDNTIETYNEEGNSIKMPLQLKYFRVHASKEPSGNQSSEKDPLSEYCKGL